jgi:hypothetical protein
MFTAAAWRHARVSARVPTPPFDLPAHGVAAAACGACTAPLAPDQRYCLECGTRVGELPRHVAELIGATVGEHQAGYPADDDAAAEDGDLGLDRLAMVSPRAAAIAVLGVLAFGSLLGSLVTPPASSDASTPVIVAVAPPAATAAAPQDAALPPETSADDAAEPDAGDVPADAPAEDGSAAGDSSSSTTDDGKDSAPVADSGGLPKVKHVFLIVLSGHGHDDLYGEGSKAAYLSTTLRRQGELINNYYAATQGELANGIALISGQGPTAQTQANCPQYADITPATISDTNGQVTGDGCVYPAATKTLAGQLKADGKTWKAYIEDQGNGPVGEAMTCRHPTLGAADTLTAPRPGDAYVTWRNPFVYFHSILDDASSCSQSDVALGQLDLDLTSAATTPALSYIVPSRCHDGSDAACADGQPAGLAATDAWLKNQIPRILKSPAYREGGLIAITSDQAPQTGEDADATACCTPAPFPNLAAASTATPASTTAPAASATPPATTAPDPASTVLPATTATAPSTAVPATGEVAEPPGGGRVGLLLISPFVKAGSTNVADSYNHFSLLRSIEDLFGLDHLGYAADPAMPAFDKVVYNAR